MKVLSSQDVYHSADEYEVVEYQMRQEGEVGRPSGIQPRSRDGDAPLSFGQEQLWFLDQLRPGNPAYSIAASVRLDGALDTVALEQALRALVSRHEALRTTV